MMVPVLLEQIQTIDDLYLKMSQQYMENYGELVFKCKFFYLSNMLFYMKSMLIKKMIY